ncbi:hypothetical protein DYB32_005306 [Aphanomyces invadans]|uniref:Uncharacterized protein n=1 Tax=Aphanomyces invadans TaxID=157072 RepID=A0A418AUX3_9STRA|nr:hypothetical protein DYB32_005306 [Aphanomyces invadans]
MEAELIHQRDVAKEMVHELRRQVEALQKREGVIEQRALTAELRRHQFEMTLKRCKHQIDTLETNLRHHVVSILLGGLLGAFFGWLMGICLVMIDTPPFVAFFLMGPFVLCGAMVGIAAGLARRQQKLLAQSKRMQYPVFKKSILPAPKRSALGTAIVCAKEVSYALYSYIRS